MDAMPGDREAAGAADGMAETYGREVSVGERVSFRTAPEADEYETGVVRVVLATGGGRRSAIIEVAGGAPCLVPLDWILPY